MNVKERLKKNPIVCNIYNAINSFAVCAATCISPTLNTKIQYRKVFRKELNLKNPQTLNEKILWLKLNTYNKNPLVIQCADKFEVRKYVADCGLEDILIPLIGAWDSPEQIPWEELPERFVLKWNFGAGMNIVCTDKLKMNKQDTIKQLKKWGKCKYWLPHSEMQYKYIKPKIVCEELLNSVEVSQI